MRTIDGGTEEPSGAGPGEDKGWDWGAPSVVLAIIAGMGVMAALAMGWVDRQRAECGEWGVEVAREAELRAYSDDPQAAGESFEYFHDVLDRSRTLRTFDGGTIERPAGCTLPDRLRPSLAGEVRQRVPDGTYRLPDRAVLVVDGTDREVRTGEIRDDGERINPTGEARATRWTAEAFSRLLDMISDGATLEAAIAYARPDLAGRTADRID